MNTSDSQVLQSLNDFRGEFNVFVTKLLGDPDGDTPTGRIPLLEAASQSHEKRLTRIERGALMLVGAAGLLKVLAWSAESIHHILEILR